MPKQKNNTNRTCAAVSISPPPTNKKRPREEPTREDVEDVEVTVLARLGKGSFGKIDVVAVTTGSKTLLLARKTFIHEKEGGNGEVDDAELKFNKEHTNLENLKGLVKKCENEPVPLVNGMLATYVTLDRKIYMPLLLGSLNASKMRKLFRESPAVLSIQLFDALHSLATNLNMAHMDLSPGNVGLYTHPARPLGHKHCTVRLVLLDYATATTHSEYPVNASTPSITTPEATLMAGRNDDAGYYQLSDPKADVWAAAVIIHRVLLLHYPFLPHPSTCKNVWMPSNRLSLMVQGLEAPSTTTPRAYMDAIVPPEYYQLFPYTVTRKMVTQRLEHAKTVHATPYTVTSEVPPKNQALCDLIMGLGLQYHGMRATAKEVVDALKTYRRDNPDHKMEFRSHAIITELMK